VVQPSKRNLVILGADLAMWGVGKYVLGPLVKRLPGRGQLPPTKTGDSGGKVNTGGGKGVARSLDDLSSLRGATWKEAESLIPKNWTRGPLNKGESIKYVNTAKKGEQI